MSKICSRVYRKTPLVKTDKHIPVLLQSIQRNETARKREKEVKDRQKANFVLLKYH